MKILLCAILLAQVAMADTIRTRTTHEGVGFTNITVVTISKSNEVERIKGWAAENGPTQRVDKVVAEISMEHVVSWSKEWKRKQVELAKEKDKQEALEKFDKDLGKEK